MSIELKVVDRTNIRDVLNIKVLDTETDFVAPNVYSLAEAYVEQDLNPRLIYAGSKPVGFIMYGRWSGEESYWITRLMISAEHRGQGYARDAIRLVMDDLFSREDCDRISISFVPGNRAAMALYESLGFREVGMIEDEIRYELRR